MQNILMVFSKYSATASDPYLTNDLVNEFIRQGHRVTVIAYGDTHSSKNSFFLEERILGISSSIKILKYAFLWPILFLRLASKLRKKNFYDQIVVIAPLSVFGPAIFLIRLFAAKKKTAMIFDIYPIHQLRIKVLPSWSEKILKSLEIMLLKGFTEVTVMGQNNLKYVRDYYFSRYSNMPIKVVHLWGQPNRVVTPVWYEGGPIRVIFGGQVISGRSIDKLIDFLGILRERDVDISLTFFSSGEGYTNLRKRYAEYKWISFQDRIDRNEYISTLSQYNVGAIVTDENADLPAFPSKIIDYIYAGLSCFCLVEEQSELLNVVGGFRQIHINGFDFTDSAILAAVEFFGSIGSETTRIEASELSLIFSVATAVSRILA